MSWCSSGSMTTLSASRIWSLVGMGPSLAGAATRRRAVVGQPSRASICARRARAPSRRSSPSVAAISSSATPWASMPRIASSGGSSRSPSARSARGSSGRAQLTAQDGGERARRRRLREHGVGAGDRGPDPQPGVGEGAVDHDPRRLRQRARAQAQRQAVVVGQVQVQQRDRRAQVGDRLEALLRRRRGGDDAQALLVVEQPAQAGAHRGMVVDDDEIQHRPRMLDASAPVYPGSPVSRRLGLHQSAPDGVAHELHAVAHAELGRGCSCGGAPPSSRSARGRRRSRASSAPRRSA